MTLIEVVAGLGLLATLMAALLMARSRHTHQAMVAERKLSAVTAADRLLTEWWAEGMSIPRDKTGEYLHDRLIWQTTTIKDEDAESLDVEIVRLEVFDLEVREDALAVVEVVVPAMAPADEEQPAEDAPADGMNQEVPAEQQPAGS